MSIQTDKATDTPTPEAPSVRLLKFFTVLDEFFDGVTDDYAELPETVAEFKCLLDEKVTELQDMMDLWDTQNEVAELEQEREGHNELTDKLNDWIDQPSKQRERELLSILGRLDTDTLQFTY